MLCDANHNRAVQHYLISPLTHIINTWLLLAWMSNQQSYGHMALTNKCWWGREALHGDEEPISLSQEWLAYLYYLVHLGALMMMKGGWASILVKRVILFHHARLTLFLILSLHIKVRSCVLVAFFLALPLVTKAIQFIIYVAVLHYLCNCLLFFFSAEDLLIRTSTSNNIAASELSTIWPTAPAAAEMKTVSFLSLGHIIKS